MANEPDNRLHIAAEGSKFVIEWAVCTDGTMPARDFFYTELPKKTQNAFRALFKQLADTGRIRSKIKFNPNEANDFCAFKHKTPDKRMVRFACFQKTNRRWIITFGFFKPAQSEWPTWANNAAVRIRDEHNQRDTSS